MKLEALQKRLLIGADQAKQGKFIDQSVRDIIAEAKLEQLAANPEIGKRRPEIRPGYYSFPVEKHIIFYLHSANYIDNPFQLQFY
jgi:plasmid stabilization system protein ParE